MLFNELWPTRIRYGTILEIGWLSTLINQTRLFEELFRITHMGARHPLNIVWYHSRHASTRSTPSCWSACDKPVAANKKVSCALVCEYPCQIFSLIYWSTDHGARTLTLKTRTKAYGDDPKRTERTCSLKLKHTTERKKQSVKGCVSCYGYPRRSSF